MNHKILIITHSEDNDCVAHVVQYLQAEGAEVVRLDVDRYPLHVNISTAFDGEQWRTFLIRDGDPIRIDDCSALWFRRAYNIGKGLEQALEKKYVGPSIGEATQTLFGMIEGMTCYRLGSMSLYRRMDSKEEQLKVAQKLGLEIPRTCITNDAATARQFVQNNKKGTIVKMQSGFAIYEDGKEEVVFTNEVSEDNFNEIAGLQYCPMQFQEKIEKQVEIRVTLVGDALYTFEIDSQSEERAKVDWRKEGLKMVHDWKPHQLPAGIREKLMALMDYYQHDYGAIDLILRPDGTYVFLEVNAAGEFFWLDLLCDHAISEKIASVLLGKSKRRIR